MKKEEFYTMAQKIFSERTHFCKIKMAEYTHNDNPFDNFDRQAHDIEVSPLIIWRVYAAKHWDAITTFVKNPSRESTESIESRIDDLQNYLDLLRGMLCRDALKMKEGKTLRSCLSEKLGGVMKNFKEGRSSDPAGTSSKAGGEKLD